VLQYSSQNNGFQEGNNFIISNLLDLGVYNISVKAWYGNFTEQFSIL